MRIVKASGLILIVALVLTAFGASTASASWSDVQAQGTWVAAPTGTHQVTFGGDQFNCTNTGFSGYGAGGDAIIVPKPQLKGCTNSYGGGEVDWNMNTCDYTLNLGGAESDPGSVDINNCTSPISWRFVNVGGTCEIQIPMQSGVKVLNYQSTGSTKEGDLSLQIGAKLTGIKYTEKGNLCTNPGTHEDGTYTGAWTADDGLRFRSSTSALSGSAVETQRFGFAGPEYGPVLTCQKVNYGGSVAAPATSVLLAPAYSECKVSVLGFNIVPTISMGGCSYNLNVHGGLSIVGANCAANPITVKASNALGSCKVIVGPQFLGTVALSNVSKAVQMSPNISTLAHTVQGTLCPSEGTFSNGTFTGASKVSASGGLSIS